MKKLIFAVVGLIALNAEARILWLNSEVPQRAQTEVEYEISKACPRLVETSTLTIENERKKSFSDMDVYMLDIRDQFSMNLYINVQVEVSKDLRDVRVTDVTVYGECQ